MRSTNAFERSISAGYYSYYLLGRQGWHVSYCDLQDSKYHSKYHLLSF